MSAHVTVLQFADGREVCMSYGVPVAGFVPGIGAIQTDRKYSRTTSRHAAQYVRAMDDTRAPMADDAFRAHFPELGTVVVRRK